MEQQHQRLSNLWIFLIIILIIISTTLTRWMVIKTSDEKIRELEQELTQLQEYSQDLENQLTDLKQVIESVNLQINLIENQQLSENNQSDKHTDHEG